MEILADPSVSEHTGFILAEEAALKQHLSGIEVPNPRGEEELSEVPVWFRWPESERRMSYPFITIDLIGVNPAYDRWTSIFDAAKAPVDYYDDEGFTRSSVYYPGYTSDIGQDPDKSYYIERYLGYNLMFQVSTFARSAYHDRFLTSRMMVDVFPPRSFFIHVPVDGVMRRCELLQWVSGDTMETNEAAKRMFRKVYTVLMETEIPVSKIVEYEKISKVHLDFYDRADSRRESVTHDADEPHQIAVTSSTYVDPEQP